ncbi:MAG: hypothetical protein ACP5NZ_04475 [Nanobdellota archaeon]
MQRSRGWLMFIVIILLVLLVWGLIGSSEAAKLGTDCDLGIGDDGSALCWKWHRNTIGQLGDSLNDLLGGNSGK